MSDQSAALEEYKVLHAELSQHVQETLALERYAVAGVAAVFSWLVTKKVGTGPPWQWVWLLPVLLPLFGGLRCFALYRHMGLIASPGKIRRKNSERPVRRAWVGSSTLGLGAVPYVARLPG